MTKKTLNDLDIVELFTHLQEQGNYPFFEDDVTSVALAFQLKYSDRPISSKIEHVELIDIANMIHVLYNKNWKKQYNLVMNELIDGVSSSESSEQFSDMESQQEQNRTSQDGTRAFNQDGFVAESDDDELSINDSTQSQTSTKTNTKKSIWAVQQQLSIYRRNFIEDVVFQDILKYVALSIYK